ncbi:MAG: acyltransferase family protein [Lachnospiraceae bacterium]|nr:acyltransferase family protein [Lachnospiraceae bacterium]
MEKERYVELDIAKGMGILLVITGHIQYISEAFRNFIVAFHIPLFFIISGMLICIQGEDKKSLAKTVMKKGRSILQPYFIFSLIFLISQYVAFLAGGSISLALVKQNLYLTVIFSGMSVLWFLAALFVGEMAFLVIVKSCKKILVPIVLTLWMIISCIANRYLQLWRITCADHPYTEYLFYFLQMLIRIGVITFFVGTGFYLWKYRKEKLTTWAAGILGILFLGATVLISRANGGVDLHYLIFQHEAFYFAGAVLGSLGILALSFSLKGLAGSFPFRILQFYGKNSLIVMMTHVDTYLMYASTILVMHFNKDIVEYQGNIRFCLELFILVSLAESIVVLIINRFFPWMVGKKREEK